MKFSSLLQGFLPIYIGKNFLTWIEMLLKIIGRPLETILINLGPLVIAQFQTVVVHHLTVVQCNLSTMHGYATVQRHMVSSYRPTNAQY